MTNRVALAFSGGLDTTVCVPLLEEEYGYDEVVGVTVDVGQPEAEFEEAEETAEALDLEHYVVDAREEFAELCFDSVRANATYQGYPLGTALARPVIAEAILGIAEEHDCDALAHGCTGKGNDQLRFETVWRGSDREVIAPVRELGLTREWETEYADEKGLPVEGGNEGAWSIDTNLWSRSVEGDDLEDPTHVPPEEIYDWTTTPGDAEGEALVEIGFEMGFPVTLNIVEETSTGSQPSAENGEATDPVELIKELNELAGQYGVGRTDMMEDRMLGLKVRENYEHPAATVLLTAHEALEGLVFTESEREFKQRIDDQWAKQGYEGLVDSPLVNSLEGYLDAGQEKVTGTVTVKLQGGQCRPVARDSEYGVYSESAASFNTETVDGIEQADATGVAKYHGFQERLADRVLENAKTGEGGETLAADGGCEDERSESSTGAGSEATRERNEDGEADG